MEINR